MFAQLFRSFPACLLLSFGILSFFVEHNISVSILIILIALPGYVYSIYLYYSVFYQVVILTTSSIYYKKINLPDIVVVNIKTGVKQYVHHLTIMKQYVKIYMHNTESLLLWGTNLEEVQHILKC